MRNWKLAGLVVGLWAVGSASRGQEPMDMPKPTKEHALLEQFAGEWNSEAKMVGETGDEQMVCRGTEATRSLGGFWLVSDAQGEFMGQPVGSMMTLGYDAAKEKYVGTFVCTQMDYMWEYEGEFDESGKKLILHTEGPDMTDPTKTAKYQETLELVDADHKEFTSFVEDADGELHEIVKVTYTRKK